jgi:hypothetical protein
MDNKEIRLVASEKEIIALMMDLKGRQMHDHISQQLANELVRITKDNGALIKQTRKERGQAKN